MKVICAACAAAIVCALGTGAAAGRAGPSPSALSLRPVASDPAWASLIESPASADPSPARILSTSGDVRDPEALLHPGDGATTTLSYPVGGTAPSIVLDFGRELGGIAQFGVVRTTADTLKVAYSEQLANLSATGDESVTPVAFQSGNLLRVDSIGLLAPGVVSSPEIQGGERYERITLTLPGTLVLRSATIHLTIQRSTAATLPGHFLSSDGLLNRIWYAGLYTLNLNEIAPGTETTPGAVDHLHLLIDGAKRDRAIWSGDQLISDMTDYYSVDQPAYVHDTLAVFGDHPASTATVFVPALGIESQPGPLAGACSIDTNLDDLCIAWSASYSMAFVPALYQYYLHTGDLAFVRQEWQSVTRQMQWDAEQVDKDGLFAVTTLDSEDWNLDTPTGQLTYVNAVYYETLRDAGLMAAALGDTAAADSYAASAARLEATVNATLWDAKAGIYDAGTTDRRGVVQDANVTAIDAGLTTPAQAASILGVLSTALRTPYGPIDASPVPAGYTAIISPYMAGFQLQAEFQSGEADAALGLMRTEWGFMVQHDPGGTVWEKIFPNGTLGALGSAAHAWSTGPTSALPEFVLGVTPASPGYATWAIAPQPGSLRWAQGTVPTPRGPIVSRWRRTGSGRSFELTIAAPAGTSGTVAVPLLGARRVIARDGRVVWNGRQGRGARLLDGAVVFSGVTGRHTYAW